ncbi:MULTISPECIES: glycosyltransferase family 2 protein [unclassified Oceanobacter]|uniref:glycosyltransferase family 2 protein n=1 Tax=unclassified Oceanobacter TaxID=2620260 RepID=UPI0027372697|nr:MULTISPECIES: glycosyltransferase [unclassified Oceanobacter]MDP2608070.1 glycosyltransferase [Oceanobacter sp. 1_MG-2023]MDP2611268.1 glycosyltransferase [Oceanobacter sp. 2_MG-2023]
MNDVNHQDSGGMPLVSVGVTTKNRRCLVKIALQSVANQSYSNIEIILVDDRTEDDYSSVDEYFGRKFYYKVLKS